MSVAPLYLFRVCVKEQAVDIVRTVVEHQLASAIGCDMEQSSEESTSKKENKAC